MSRSFALRIVGDRFYFFNISIINWKREQVQTYSLCQIGPWRASPLPHLSGFPLVIPSACGRNEIYHLKTRFVRIQQKQGKHLAGVQFLLYLAKKQPVFCSKAWGVTLTKQGQDAIIKTERAPLLAVSSLG